MKIVKTAAAMAVALSTTSALAGSISPVTVIEPRAAVEEPMRNGSGSWILPILLLGIVALAVSNSDSGAPTPIPPTPPTPG